MPLVSMKFIDLKFYLIVLSVTWKGELKYEIFNSNTGAGIVVYLLLQFSNSLFSIF